MSAAATSAGPRRPQRTAAGRVRRGALVVASVAVGILGLALGAAAAIVGVRRLADGIGLSLSAATVESWPRMESIDLALDLRRPPEFSARAKLALADVRTRRIPLLLNRELSPISAASAAGEALEWTGGPRLRSRYFREARVTWIDLGREPVMEGERGERVELDLAYAGRGADGSEGRDWRGILLLAPDELRMSVQTVFYPLVPESPSADGPGVQRAKARVEVLAPADFEVFVPGSPVDPAQAPWGEPVGKPGDGARDWRFELATPSVLSVLGGRRVRHEVDEAGLRVVSLLSPEHAELGPRLLEDARAALRFFSERFGPIDGQVLGIVEITGRGDSYNWAAQGVAAFESGAFQADGLPAEKVGHELAHLWWGQAVAARGEGERFLTEGLAEYSSWRWVEEARGRDEAWRMARAARDEYLRSAHEHGEDPALARVGFATEGYSALAYEKGALVLRAAERGLGREAFDAGLRRYVAASRVPGGTLDGLLVSLYGTVERGEKELPWARRDGHAHVQMELLAVDMVSPLTRGAVVLAECPDGAASIAPRRIDVRLAGTGEGFVSVEFDSDGRAEFGIGHAANAVVLDPGGYLVGTGDLVHSLQPIRIVRSEPAQGAVDAPYVIERIVLEFDRPLAPLPKRAYMNLRSAINAGAKARGKDAPFIAEPSLEQDGRVLVFPLVTPLSPGSDVVLALGDVLQDAEGVPVEDVVLEFRTVATTDADRPIVIAAEPPDGATDVDPKLGRIRFTFSEPMRVSRGYSGTEVRELEEEGWLFPLAVGVNDYWESGGTALVYELEKPLQPGKRYCMPLRGLFRDLAGNRLVDFEYRFETRAP